MLRIFLTIAISVATCERTFSKLKLITKLLKVCYELLKDEKSCHIVYREKLTDEIDLNNVIDNFANRKVRKAFCRNR